MLKSSPNGFEIVTVFLNSLSLGILSLSNTFGLSNEKHFASQRPILTIVSIILSSTFCSKDFLPTVGVPAARVVSILSYP